MAVDLEDLLDDLVDLRERTVGDEDRKTLARAIQVIQDAVS